MFKISLFSGNFIEKWGSYNLNSIKYKNLKNVEVLVTNVYFIYLFSCFCRRFCLSVFVLCHAQFILI